MASDTKKQMVSNDRLANERKKRQWTQSDLASELYRLCDEEELAEHGTIDGNMVSKWERGLHTPGFFWQRKLRELFGLDAAALGFIDHFKTEGPDRPQESSPIQSTKNANADECQPIQIILPNSSPYIVTVHVYQQAKSSTSNPPKEDGILATRMVNALGQGHLSERENTVNRRDFNRKALGVAAGAFVSPDDLLNTELLDRFHRALKKPSTIDGRFLDYLEIRTANYWQDRHGAALASSDLLSYVVEHFEKILRLLEGPMSPTERIRLCSIASKTSLLIGELLLDMSYYARAREFQSSALTAAQETNNQALEAISWGRLSLAWTYSKNAPNALACVQEARHLAAESSTSLVNAWLAAIESEAQVNLHHWDACLKALDAAEHIEDQQDSPEDNYLIHFDRYCLHGLPKLRYPNYRHDCLI